MKKVLIVLLFTTLFMGELFSTPTSTPMVLEENVLVDSNTNSSYCFDFEWCDIVTVVCGRTRQEALEGVAALVLASECSSNRDRSGIMIPPTP